MNKRRRSHVLALIVPLPVLLAAGLLLRGLGARDMLRAMVEFPAVSVWGVLAAMGFRQPGSAAGLTAGLWYLVLALLAHAVLCRRARLGGAMLVSVAGAIVVGLAVHLVLR